jgi:hypothetical protein
MKTSWSIVYKTNMHLIMRIENAFLLKTREKKNFVCCYFTFAFIMFSRFRITKNTCWILEDHCVVQGQCSFFFNLELIRGHEKPRF